MKIKFLIALCSAISLCVEVYADAEQEVRRGIYPYMAILYYPDESVVDGTGSRFLRGAVLIRPDFLVTSAVGPSIVTDTPNGFPRKTLLARLGAITIDTNFTLNEDEDEQEREVIQIVRPYNHSSTQWWRTDISLMKVLSAFNLTSSVGITILNPKRDLAEKTCIILVFAKKDGNDTEDRSLIQISVEMLPPSIQNCGSHFIGNTMTCATDSDENKNAAYDSNFCQGNSGGPLICENEVAGIQTYIDNDCKQPHLYQLLSAWENFVTCGTEDKCQEEQCSNICDVINKDTLVISTSASSEETEASTEKTEAFSEKTEASSEKTEASSEKTEASSEKTELSSEKTEPSSEKTGASSEKEKVIMMKAELSPELQITSTVAETAADDSEIVSSPSTTNVLDEITTTDILAPSVSEPTAIQALSEVETSDSKTWPNDKYFDDQKKHEQLEIENRERNPSVQARQHTVKVHSAGPSNMSNTLSVFVGFFILACLS